MEANKTNTIKIKERATIWFDENIHTETTKSFLEIWSRRLLYFTLSAVFLVISLIIIPDFFVAYGRTILHFDDKTGTIGDTIGGTLGPFIGAIAAILTFFAFWVQYQANQQQKIDLAKERFENKFFEMLRFHKDNINEMTIEGYDISKTVTNTFHPTGGNIIQETEQGIGKEIKNRKIFVTIYNELRACYEICQNVLHFEKFDNKEEYLIKISYLLIYNGAGNNILTSVDTTVEGDELHVLNCKKELLKARLKHIQTNGASNIYTISNSNIKVKIPIKFKPFSGHSSRFGHYYRHLFLIVKYVHSQPKSLVSENDKRDYLRMLRAQLSGHEQLMLYINFLSGYGKKWENEQNRFFSDYRMIHNLPLALTKFTIDPHIKFEKQIKLIKKKGEEMFEDDEPKID